MTSFDALALLISSLKSSLSPSSHFEKAKLSESMINFICVDLDLKTQKELCILLCLPKYLPTDRLHLVGGLLSFKIKTQGTMFEKDGNQGLIQEYSKLTEAWKTISQEYLEMSEEELNSLGQRISDDLNTLKMN